MLEQVCLDAHYSLLETRDGRFLWGRGGAYVLDRRKGTLREAFEGYLRVVLETEESRTAFLKEICSAMNLEKCISFMGSR